MLDRKMDLYCKKKRSSLAPSTYHDDNPLDVSGQCLVTTFFPVIGTRGLFSQHHGRAMGEEVYWREAYASVSRMGL